ncbi:Lrp/AsnC family transcriptional regulator [Gimibacter soli]|uniref:Lrp/AsnC family transcriptional regulator n=1 Tax=Gimibacter soli TaxID=3024400 RepID=A0AAE9XMT1_9PROT|nr:Lrp/AsnC family transcriptional regulator [Gimibacter soli]WCL53873.1 Lrp/AsnC family transcriptional regulator [Gimibacter soli]
MSLDALDTRILTALQEDSRIPLNDLAEKVASSRSAVWRRIQKMEADGVIKNYTVILDPEKVGLGVMVFASVKMQAHSRDLLPHFLEKVREFPEVIECHTLMGDIDFLIKIRVKDVTAYETFFWTKLSQIDGVREISSSIALTAVKNTTMLALTPAG